MSNRNKNLNNNLRGAQNDPLEDYLNKAEKNAQKKELEKGPEGNSPFRKFFVVFVIVLSGMFLAKGFGNITLNPLKLITQTAIIAQQPSEDLLNRMNARMVEMGYTGLNHDDLRDLRAKGVTATYITNIRAIGFTDLTLEQAVSLAQADASSAFMAMMLELGYDLDIEDFILLRRAGVTAHYTSNIHDLGYRDVTVEQLIRMRRIGVTTSLIERLQQERGEDIPLEEIIRYRISNQ